MRKGRLLNSELTYEIAKLGRKEHITICDANLPLASGVKKIDLALEAGMPSLINVLDTVLSEMAVGEIILAEEIKIKNAEILEKILVTFKKAKLNPKIVWVSHERLEEMTGKSRAVVRTGECSPYANILLKLGPVF